MCPDCTWLNSQHHVAFLRVDRNVTWCYPLIRHVTIVVPQHLLWVTDILMLRKYRVFIVWQDHYHTYRMRPLDAAQWSQLTACRLTTSRFSTTEFKGKGKGNAHSVTCHEGPEWSRGIAPVSLASALDEDSWSTRRPGRFTAGKDPLAMVKEDGWGPEPI